jgi:hypothetical protein
VTAGLPACDRRRRQRATAFLVRQGAAVIPHLNGYLLDHLERTEGRFAPGGVRRQWPWLVSATRPTALTDSLPSLFPSNGGGSSEVVGPEVEALVYLYASCDRDFVYPTLRDGVWPHLRTDSTVKCLSPASTNYERSSISPWRMRRTWGWLDLGSSNPLGGSSPCSSRSGRERAIRLKTDSSV